MSYKKVVEDRVKNNGKLSDLDYYILDSGLLIFTEEYHKKRGYCCGLKCKHCPFYPKYQRNNTIIDPKDNKQ